MIRLNKVNKYFNRGKQNEIHVIDNVDLELPERGMVAIFGKSGCGKTTLLNVIGGLDGFERGDVTIEDNDIRKNTDELRNRYVGYIFQNYNLNNSESCFENVADALRLCGMKDEEEIERRVMAALKNVGMEKYRLRTPDTLSGGQQQRIAIARAIVKNPRIVLADEPTGNLDEANTVVVMNLLKQISREHLVVIVTHEANLVDFYCDSVIELKDGRVESVRQNSGANGYTTRDKNDIFLGELEKSEQKTANAEVEYYGAAPEEPVKIKVVNSGGKLYLRIDTPKVQVLDSSSEVKLKEGVFERQADASAENAAFDMSQLPPVEGKKFGRLFSFKNALKSGFSVNFKKGKKGRKLLFVCMGLFAAVVVLMTAFFGTAVGDLLEVEENYNHNVFYLRVDDGTVSERLSKAVNDESSAIDFVRIYDDNVPRYETTVAVQQGSFETFDGSTFWYRTSLLGASLTDKMTLLAGKMEIADDEVIITSAFAESIMNSGSYFNGYSSLLGLRVSNIIYDASTMRIAGVVRSSERAMYLAEPIVAKYSLNQIGRGRLSVVRAAEYGVSVNEGEAALCLSTSENTANYPSLNSKIKIRGQELTLSSITVQYSNYLDYLNGKGLYPGEYYDYVIRAMAEEYPAVEEGSVEYEELLQTLYGERYYEYAQSFCAHLDDFVTALSMGYNRSIEAWLAAEKGVEEAKYLITNDERAVWYWWAQQFVEINGRVPNYVSDAQSYSYEDAYMSLADVVKENVNRYYDEFYENWENFGSDSSCYLLNDADYIAISKQVGETVKSALMYPDYGYDYDYDYDYDYPVDDVAIDSGAAEKGDEIAPSVADNRVYILIHSSNPQRTKAFLESEFAYLSSSSSYPAVVTPEYFRQMELEDQIESIVMGAVTYVVILALMCVCMYFIMRSSLLNRVKEVGIYRAIGVSKKNLIFRFLIEALVLTTLTVFIGYLLMSGFIALCLGTSSLMEMILFYPFWMALCVLALLYVLCLICGILPILSLLKKSPSAILAKYDI